MVINRFEELKASPALEQRAFINASRNASLSDEVRAQYTKDLLTPEIRLFDELTTLRFGRPAEENKSESMRYRKACRALSGSLAQPIPFMFFSDTFMKLSSSEALKDRDITADGVLSEAIEQISDPWEFQPWAALLLRIAVNTEESAPTKAPGVWEKALAAYDRFFNGFPENPARVEDTSTWKRQNDDLSQTNCREAWDGFLVKLVEDLEKRAGEYPGLGKPLSAESCLKVLGSDAVQKIKPGAGGSALLPYVRAIRNASSLAEAEQLYKKFPSFLKRMDSEKEAEQAMFAAMAKEVGNLEGHPENIFPLLDVHKLIRGGKLYQSGSFDLKAAASEFYDKANDYTTKLGNHSDSPQDLAAGEYLVTIFPDDFNLGRTSGGTTVTRENYETVLLNKAIKLRLDKLNSNSADQDFYLCGKAISDALRTFKPLLMDGDFVWSLLTNVVVGVGDKASHKNLDYFYATFDFDWEVRCNATTNITLQELFRTISLSPRGRNSSWEREPNEYVILPPDPVEAERQRKFEEERRKEEEKRKREEEEKRRLAEQKKREEAEKRKREEEEKRRREEEARQQRVEALRKRDEEILKKRAEHERRFRDEQARLEEERQTEEREKQRQREIMGEIDRKHPGKHVLPTIAALICALLMFCSLFYNYRKVGGPSVSEIISGVSSLFSAADAEEPAADEVPEIITAGN